MYPSTATAVSALVAGQASHEGARALLTYCDDATGERTELTAAALGSLVARTAAMLRDGCQLGSGDRAAVLLPPHWQTAAVLLGAWATGVAVSSRSWASVSLPPAAHQETLGAVFVARSRVEAVPQARHRFVLGLAPHGAALDEVPDGYQDYLVEVHRYPDTVPPYWAIEHEELASSDGTSYREWAGVAHSIAESMGLRPGDRLMVDVAKHDEPVKWLLAPLSASASIVICANLSPEAVAERIEAEGITHVL
jgi:uncharacterized protein (TIGR03089 family)